MGYVYFYFNAIDNIVFNSAHVLHQSACKDSVDGTGTRHACMPSNLRVHESRGDWKHDFQNADIVDSDGIPDYHGYSRFDNRVIYD